MNTHTFQSQQQSLVSELPCPVMIMVQIKAIPYFQVCFFPNPNPNPNPTPNPNSDPNPNPILSSTFVSLAEYDRYRLKTPLTGPTQHHYTGHGMVNNPPDLYPYLYLTPNPNPDPNPNPTVIVVCCTQDCGRNHRLVLMLAHRYCLHHGGFSGECVCVSFRESGTSTVLVVYLKGGTRVRASIRVSASTRAGGRLKAKIRVRKISS